MQLYQLNRLTEIDSHIDDLHQEIDALVKERNSLLTVTNAFQVTGFDTKKQYEAMADIWKSAGVDVPAFRVLAPRLRLANKRMISLLQENPTYQGALRLLLTPPSVELKTAIRTTNFVVRWADDKVMDLPSNQDWKLTIIISKSFAVPDKGLQAFQESARYNYLMSQATSIGLLELIAAELQGITVVNEGTWTMLVNESGSSNTVCATKRNGSLVIDVDDADGLVGDNFITLVVEA